jgi:predicted NBD/HSP70 family sugar kinase
MRLLGVELGDDRVTAVSVDEHGAIQSRGRETVTNGQLAAAAGRAVRAALGKDAADSVGVTAAFHADALPPDVSGAVADAADQTPITVNAGRAIALAEVWCGAAKGLQDVVSFAIGDHVTAGILVGGQLLTGASGHAGSVAWLALNPVEREDYRRHGGLEAEVAAAGIVRRLVWRIKSGDRSRVTDRVGGDLSKLTADDVFAAARDGDGVCVSVIRDTAKYVGMAVGNLATVLDPECVVLGGTLATSGDLMFDAIRSECARRIRPSQSERVRIVLSALGDEAAAIGAARAAMMQRR